MVVVVAGWEMLGALMMAAEGVPPVCMGVMSQKCGRLTSALHPITDVNFATDHGSF
jgi:hypothetical protein